MKRPEITHQGHCPRPLGCCAIFGRYRPLSTENTLVPNRSATRSITSRSVIRHTTCGERGEDGGGLRKVPSASSRPASQKLERAPFGLSIGESSHDPIIRSGPAA